MLDSFRRGQRWLTLIFVSVIGLVFVFFLGVGGSFGPATPSGNAIVELDELRLTQADFARERAATEAQLRSQLGDAYDQVGGDQYVDARALSSMISEVVLAEAASELGLHVTRDEVRRFVRSAPAFIDQEGRFSPDAFDRFASYEYGSQRAFIQSFSRELLGQKLVQLLVSQTTLSDAELDLRTRYELEEVRIAYVGLDATALSEDETVADEEVEAFASANEDALRAIFADREPDLAQPERVRARHILSLAPAEASEEEAAKAHSRVEAALARIEAGEDFAVVAQEVSEDVGTRENGGDLGLFARGSNDPALDEAAFALAAGEISGIVRSAYGFHVLQVEEKLAASTPRFEDHRVELAREGVSRERALERANDLVDGLTAAIDAGQTLEDAAREAGLTLERPPSLKRHPDGFIPGLGAAEAMLTTAFALPAGTSSTEVFDIGPRRVLIQVLERTEPSEATLVSERAARRGAALAEKQGRILQAWVDDRRRKLEDSGRLLVNAELALGT